MDARQKKMKLPTLFKILLFSRRTYVHMYEVGNKGGNLEFYTFRQHFQRIIWYKLYVWPYIVLAWYLG